jgi:cyclic pyranopterin monophosphate synthase
MGMVDVSEKAAMKRSATAEGRIRLKESTIKAIRMKKTKKGDCIQVAEVAAMLAVKNTPSLIPHCHQIPIESVYVEFDFSSESILCRVMVAARAKTGVEMEALAGVNAALLTIWDMVKYLEKDDAGQYPNTHIDGVRVVRKVKG